MYKILKSVFVFAYNVHIWKRVRIPIIQVNEQLIQDHHVVHTIHFLPHVEPQHVSNILLRFVHLDENPINQSNTTLKFANVHTKRPLLLNIKPLNFIAYGFINVGCNENCIITNYTLTLVSHECIIHDHIVMFHVNDEFKQAMLWA
jgi:hypothetical protein